MDEFSHGEAFDTCTKVLINSSIALACGPFFDRDIMHAMEICVEDVRITMNEMASKNSIALLEAQCEAALIRNPKKPFGDSIFKALNCPNQCSGNGQCQDLKGCVCDEHYEGHDCRFVKPTYRKLEYIKGQIISE